MSSDNTSPTSSTSWSQFLPDGRIQCKHNQVIRRKTCRVGTNEGKTFYSCLKHKTDPSNCKYFMWNEDLEAIATNTAPGSSSPRWIPHSELPEQTPAATSKKRERAETPSTLTHSPPGDQEFDFASFKNQLSSPPKKARIQDNESAASGSAHKLHAAIPVHDAEENPFLSSGGSPGPHKLLFDESDISDALLTLTAAVEKLRRQKIAAEKARDAKAERVVQLEKQVAQLKELNKTLQAQNNIVCRMMDEA